jgi:hypothetical protein
MPAKMIVHECRNEEIGMIVALAHIERERNASLLAGFFQQPRAQAVIQETVCGALIDKKRRKLVAILDQQ